MTNEDKREYIGEMYGIVLSKEELEGIKRKTIERIQVMVDDVVDCMKSANLLSYNNTNFISLGNNKEIKHFEYSDDELKLWIGPDGPILNTRYYFGYRPVTQEFFMDIFTIVRDTHMEIAEHGYKTLEEVGFIMLVLKDYLWHTYPEYW